MSSKAIRNEERAKEYKMRMALNKELIKNRAQRYYRMLQEAELKGEFPLALMNLKGFEAFDCLGQINELFEEASDFILKANANVFFQLYGRYGEILCKLSEQTNYLFARDRAYLASVKAFVKKLSEVEEAFVSSGYVNRHLAEKMYNVFIKSQSIFVILLEKRKTPEKRLLEKKQELDLRISYYKELSDKAK